MIPAKNKQLTPMEEALEDLIKKAKKTGYKYLVNYTPKGEVYLTLFK